MAVASASLRMPEDLVLRQANDTFALWCHIQDCDFDDPNPDTQEQVRQGLCLASFKKDDLLLTSARPLTVNMMGYAKELTCSNHDTVQDGDFVTKHKRDLIY